MLIGLFETIADSAVATLERTAPLGTDGSDKLAKSLFRDSLSAWDTGEDGKAQGALHSQTLSRSDLLPLPPSQSPQTSNSKP